MAMLSGHLRPTDFESNQRETTLREIQEHVFFIGPNSCHWRGLLFKKSLITKAKEKKRNLTKQIR